MTKNNMRKQAIIAMTSDLLSMRDEHGRGIATDAAITRIIAGAVFLELEAGADRAIQILNAAVDQVRSAPADC